MTAKPLSLLEISRGGQLVGHVVGEAPDLWVVRGIATGEHAVPAWSALRQEGVVHVNRRAWLRNLLPDAPGPAQLARRLGVSPGNDFALLGLCGGDCRGALSFARAGMPPAGEAAVQTLEVGRLRRWAEGLADGVPPPFPEPPGFLVPGETGQFPCMLLDETPMLGPDPQWIARAGRPGLDEALENEALVARMATALGLPVAPTRLLGGALPLLLTQRPDCDSTSSPGRLHVEDFNQLSGLHPEQSFEREGGLSARDCANLIRRHSAAPALDLRVLLGWLVFAFHVGLGHAHARTLALRETPRGARLVICDGLLSTHVYPTLGERLALFLGREDRPDWIRLARWREVAEELGVGPRYLLELVRQMATRLPGLAATTARELGFEGRTLSVLPRVHKLIENRSRQTLIALAAERVWPVAEAQRPAAGEEER